MQIQPYLFFDGRCEEALEFYRQAFGAEVMMISRFKDAPKTAGQTGLQPGNEEKIMHAQFRIGDAIVLASDGRCLGKPNFDGFALSINVKSADEAERLFAAISKDGQVQMPLAPTFFSPRFGMAADRFGVSWMVYAEPSMPQS